MILMVIAVLAILIVIATPYIVRVLNEEYPRSNFTWKVAIIPALVAVVCIGLGSVYAQDAGEVIVIKGLGGTLDGYTEETGFHVKAPWQSTISYDVRNNLINLYRDTKYSYDGGAAQGACVTVNDKGGASADIDLQVVYSLNADSALNLYRDYGTQEKFTSDVILNDVRAVAREVAGRYDTITLLTNRGEFTKGLRDALSTRWGDMGLNVEQVSIQDVRFDDEITKSYTKAQAAEIERSKAINEQETARVASETKKIEAEGSAEANRILSESLTPEVLQQEYIDTLSEVGKEGNLIIVPGNSSSLISVVGNE